MKDKATLPSTLGRLLYEMLLCGLVAMVLAGCENKPTPPGGGVAGSPPPVVQAPAPPPAKAEIERFLGSVRRKCVTVVVLGEDDEKTRIGVGVIVKKVGRICFVLTSRSAVAGTKKGVLPRTVTFWDGNREVPEGAKEDIHSPVIYAQPNDQWVVLTMIDRTGSAEEAEVGNDVRRGSWVMTVNGPLGGDSFHTEGSVEEDDPPNPNSTVRFVHTAQAAAGCTGGPVFDSSFKLVGINVARAGSSGEQVAAVSVPAMLRIIRFGAAKVDAAGAVWNTNMSLQVNTGEMIFACARGWWTPESRNYDAGGADPGWWKDETFSQAYPWGSMILGTVSQNSTTHEIGTFDDSNPDTYLLEQGGLRRSIFLAGMGGWLAGACNTNHPADGSGSIDLSVVVSKFNFGGASAGRSQLSKCVSCGGLGRMMCFSCGGTGKRRINALQAMTCSMCGGVGSRTCYSCGGKRSQ